MSANEADTLPEHSISPEVDHETGYRIARHRALAVICRPHNGFGGKTFYINEMR